MALFSYKTLAISLAQINLIKFYVPAPNKLSHFFRLPAFSGIIINMSMTRDQRRLAWRQNPEVYNNTWSEFYFVDKNAEKCLHFWSYLLIRIVEMLSVVGQLRVMSTNVCYQAFLIALSSWVYYEFKYLFFWESRWTQLTTTVFLHISMPCDCDNFVFLFFKFFTKLQYNFKRGVFLFYFGESLSGCMHRTEN